MDEPQRSLETLDRCGNALALDFVNTVHSRTEPRTFDYLRHYEDLVRWLESEGALSERERRRLLADAQAHPRKSARVLREARALRETLYRLLLVTIRGGKAEERDLKTFNLWLSRAAAEQRVAFGEGGFELGWADKPHALERVLWPILQSGGELLTAAPHDRLRECPGPEGGCGWLFLDTSKNATRRWCNMRTCGNLAKARRHRARS